MSDDRNFRKLLEARWAEGKFVCVGLDSDVDSPKFPDGHGIFAGLSVDAAQLEFNRRIINATHDLVCAYKPNLAFYRGSKGKDVLRRTIEFINEHAPEVPVILDAKQADIGSSNDGYVAEDFDFYGADAVTVNPYLGMEAMKPFLDRKNKGIIVLCRTSNPGAGEFQDMNCQPFRHLESGKLYSTLEEAERELKDLFEDPNFALAGDEFDRPTMPLYQFVAYRVAQSWNTNGNCGVVVGATYPQELKKIRVIVGDMRILIPGVGTQGGTATDAVENGRDSRGRGMIINASSSVIYASSGPDFAEAARAAMQKLHDEITVALAAVA